MPGQIIGRGKNVWLVRVALGRDAKGKRRFLSKTIHGNKKAAERFLNKSLRDRDLGALIEPSRTSVDDFLDSWLADVAKLRVRDRTYRDYEQILKRYVRPTLGDHYVQSLTPLSIQSLYAELQEKNLSARTIRFTHAVLKNALQYAVSKLRLLPANPADGAELPRQVKREMLALSPEQAASFLKNAEGDRFYPLFLLALTAGMRPGEYLGLQWKDVDLGKGTVVVRRTLSRKKGEWSFEEPKTPRSYRTIPLPPSVTRALTEHKRKQEEEQAKAGSEYKNHNLVFASETGGPVEERNLVNRHFKKIILAAKLPEELRLYDLRHTCATLLLGGGENPKVVSERLGHASITLTLDTYSHVLPTMQQQAAERLEDLLFGSSSA